MNVCIVCGTTTMYLPSLTRRCTKCGGLGTVRNPGTAVRELLARIEVLATRPHPPSPCAWPSTTEGQKVLAAAAWTPGHQPRCDCHDCNQARIEAAG